MDVKKDIRFRVYLTFTFICLLGIAVILKAAMIQLNEGEDLRSRSNKMQLRTDTLQAERGNIYTEDGELLCSSIPEFDAYIDFSVIKGDTFRRYVDTLSGCLSRLFGDASAARYKQILEKGYRDSLRYFPLKKNMQYYDYQALRSFPVFNKGARRGGLIVQSKTKRINPYGILAYRTIGLWRKVWKDRKEHTNLIGLEATYDSVLSGSFGTRMMQKQTGGVWMPIQGTEIDPVNGRDIVTTLDLGIQEVAEHALLDVVEQYQCLYGTCIVMEVSTGKIRAIVNLGRDEQTGKYYENENYALRRAEPGSTFKLATLISLLNDGYINVEDLVDCENGSKQFANRVMHDSHHGLKTMPVRNAFAQSSNVAMASLAYRFYYKQPEKYVQRLKDLHLSEPTGIDLRGEQSPFLMEPGKKKTGWNATTLPWMATGYGVMITPLHTCMLYNAVANGGRMMKPYLVSAVRDYGRNIEIFEPVVLKERIADSAAIAQLRRCVEEVAISGTAKHIRSPYYTIAGKTGTAQVADKINGTWYGYNAGIYQGSFVGYFPADRPRYTICVVIRTKPHSTAYYGGTLAAPVFRMIADKIFANGLGSWDGPLDSISRSGDQKLFAKMATAKSYNILLGAMNHETRLEKDGTLVMLASDSAKKPVIRKKELYKGLVPDVKGMGLRDAVYLLEREGLHVQVTGSGIVQSQSIAAGQPVQKGKTIVLQLS